jgi:ribosome-associated protein YbcJ (S4-like RNA binding protein)
MKNDEKRGGSAKEMMAEHAVPLENASALRELSNQI